MAETAVRDVSIGLGQNTVAATNLISTGTWTDTTGSSYTIYPDGYTWWPERHHHHHYYPRPEWVPALHTHSSSSAAAGEKPHETVQRAIKEIASAARELARSAEHIGVPVDRRALEEALIAKLRDAL